RANPRSRALECEDALRAKRAPAREARERGDVRRWRGLRRMCVVVGDDALERISEFDEGEDELRLPPVRSRDDAESGAPVELPHQLGGAARQRDAFVEPFGKPLLRAMYHQRDRRFITSGFL